MSTRCFTPKFGRPTKYSSKLLLCVTNYTSNCIKTESFPTIEGLALSLGVSSRTIYEWEKLYDDFSRTLELLRDTQRHLLIKNGLNGKYSTSFAAFLLKAIHGFSDTKTVVDATQNNYMNISPEVMADAIKLMRENEKSEE